MPDYNPHYAPKPLTAGLLLAALEDVDPNAPVKIAGEVVGNYRAPAEGTYGEDYTSLADLHTHTLRSSAPPSFTLYTRDHGTTGEGESGMENFMGYGGRWENATELHAAPAGTVIRGGSGRVLEKDRGGRWFAPGQENGDTPEDFQDEAPFTVLHWPDTKPLSETFSSLLRDGATHVTFTAAALRRYTEEIARMEQSAARPEPERAYARPATELPRIGESVHSLLGDWTQNLPAGARFEDTDGDILEWDGTAWQWLPGEDEALTPGYFTGKAETRHIDGTVNSPYTRQPSSPVPYPGQTVNALGDWDKHLPAGARFADRDGDVIKWDGTGYIYSESAAPLRIGRNVPGYARKSYAPYTRLPDEKE